MGCVVVLHPPHELRSTSGRKLFPWQQNGEYTAAMFKQSMSKVPQATLLNLFYHQLVVNRKSFSYFGAAIPSSRDDRYTADYIVVIIIGKDKSLISEYCL